MSDESSWSDLVEALASVPEKLARKHVWKIVCKIVWFDEKFDHLGKNKRRFVNAVVTRFARYWPEQSSRVLNHRRVNTSLGSKSSSAPTTSRSCLST